MAASSPLRIHVWGNNVLGYCRASSLVLDAAGVNSNGFRFGERGLADGAGTVPHPWCETERLRAQIASPNFVSSAKPFETQILARQIPPAPKTNYLCSRSIRSTTKAWSVSRLLSTIQPGPD